MTGALLFLLTVAQAPVAPGPDSLRAMAMHGSDLELLASVRAAPVQARDAVSLLLGSAAGVDSGSARAMLAAERLAEAIAVQLGDSFPRRQVRRFGDWSVAERRQKVAIDSLRRAGNAAMGRAGFSRALVLWQASARRARALRDTAGLASALGNIGTGYYRAGELDSATDYYARAASLAGDIGDRRTALNALGGSAGVALERGDLRAAQQLFDSALALRATIGDVRGMAADRNNIGALNERMGDVAAARESYLAALALAEQYGMDEPAAVSQLNLGKLASLRAEFPEADQRYASAQAHYEAAGNRSGQALVYEHLGMEGMRRGDYSAAARRFRSALAIYRETGPGSSVAGLRAQLARALAAAGALDMARVELERARSDLVRDPESSVAALVELTAADLAVEFNSFDAAEAGYRKAEQRYRQANDVAGRAQARQGLAYLQLMRGEPAAAAATLEPVVSALDLAGAHRDAALARVDLAFAYASAGRTMRARMVLAEARDSLRQGGDAVGEAATLDAMGDLERGDRRPVAAGTLYEQGLRVLAGHPAPNVEWQLRAGLAEAMADQKSSAAAVASMRQAVALLDRTALRIPAEQRRSRYLADKWYAYDRLARLEVQLGRDSTALEVSERMRAREMRDGLARGRIPWRPDADSTLVRQEQELRHVITELAAEADGSAPTTGVLRGPGTAPSTPGGLLEALAQAETRYADLLTTLRDRQPAYARLVAGPSATWREIAGALSSDAALLEYLVSDSAAMVFVVTRSGVRAIELATDREELAPLIDFARGVIAGTRTPGAAPNFKTPLRTLYTMLLAPVEATGVLEGIRTLIIAPQAELHYLPFAALLEQGASGRFLIEKYDLSVIPSASIWLQLRQRSPRAKGMRVLALAPEQRQLPGSAVEVAAIRTAMGSGTTVLMGAAASREGLEAGAPGHDILHFATYGVLNRRNPLLSYLELAPKGEDGRLQVADVYGMSLDARLVVLSACQTGIGSGMLADVPSGDEWVSLSQSFLMAGARNVLATLWPVEDRSTAELMKSFYEELAAGADVDVALARAQRKAIRNSRWPQPFHWAAFVLVGGP